MLKLAVLSPKNIGGGNSVEPYTFQTTEAPLSIRKSISSCSTFAEPVKN